MLRYGTKRLQAIDTRLAAMLNACTSIVISFVLAFIIAWSLGAVMLGIYPISLVAMGMYMSRRHTTSKRDALLMETCERTRLTDLP